MVLAGNGFVKGAPKGAKGAQKKQCSLRSLRALFETDICARQRSLSPKRRAQPYRITF